MNEETKRMRVIYDGAQHITAAVEAKGISVSMDCPYTGKGEEFSPGNLVGAGLIGCMLISMGTLAMRDNLDLTGTVVDIDATVTDKPVTRIGSIDLVFNMPKNFSPNERLKLERAAGTCPIKHSFHPDIPISVHYNYPG